MNCDRGKRRKQAGSHTSGDPEGISFLFAQHGLNTFDNRCDPSDKRFSLATEFQTYGTAILDR